MQTIGREEKMKMAMQMKKIKKQIQTRRRRYTKTTKGLDEKRTEMQAKKRNGLLPLPQHRISMCVSNNHRVNPHDSMLHNCLWMKHKRLLG